jgi:arsenate reductase
MAEGLLKTYFKDKYESFSAGIEPTSINPYAVEVMKEIGIDLSDQYSKSINEFHGKKFDFVVTVCDNAKETCPFFPGDKIIHKGFVDPEIIDGSIEENLTSYKKIRDEIKDWIIKKFLK